MLISLPRILRISGSGSPTRSRPSSEIEPVSTRAVEVSNCAYLTLAGFDFLDVGQRFLVAQLAGGIAGLMRGQYDDRQIFVDQGVGAMFHFARWIAFGVNVRDFLEFQRAFKRDGIVNAPSEEKKVLRAVELPGKPLVLRVSSQHRLEFGRYRYQLLHRVVQDRGWQAVSNLSQVERQDVECRELRGKRLR